MLPEQLEYAVALLLLATVGCSLTWDRLIDLARTRAFWVSILLFTLYCSVIEWIALSRGWWAFNESRIIGWKLFGVPIEELALFPVFFCLAVGAWEAARRERR